MSELEPELEPEPEPEPEPEVVSVSDPTREYEIVIQEKNISMEELRKK